MDAEQRYIEEDDGHFEIDERFLDDMKLIGLDYSLEIAGLIDLNAYFLPEKDRKVQKVGGVVKFEEPLFFEIEYYKPVEGIPIYISMKEIDVDDYLDYINLNQIFKHENIQDNAHQTN